MADPLHGIVHQSSNGTLSHLPLEEVRINAFIVDVSARVTLRQAFSNPSNISTSRAKYVFPVPSRAAVCAFELHFEDGHVITGVSKEKTEAAAEHDAAVRQGQASALVEWVTDDVFTISIGSIPAGQTVTTKLVFVMDLMDDDLRDQVRFQLPMSVGSRYGVLPSALVDAAAASSQTRLRITIDIQMSGTIHRIQSLTHPSINLVPYITVAGKPSRRRQTAKFRSLSFLEHDFVLTVHADELDAPRCFAERDPRGSGTISMQMTLVPKIKLPPIPAQEYLFVVDRSGSMSGSRIETAKRTLAMLLRMLPTAGTMLNIFSFGSHVDSMWPGSQGYTQTSLAAATSHVNGMSANYGGTEIRAALEYTLSRCNGRIPTVAFVLTDGESYDIDDTIATVQGAVTASQATAPLRVFALGIGQTVSSAMVDGIARAGNGQSLFAVASEDIVGKCTKLLRAGRSSFVENISIDWGVPEGLQNRPGTTRLASSVNFSTPNSRGQPLTPNRIQLGPLPAIQQTPAHISQIHPGMRFIVFAITTHRIMPQEVILRGQLNGGGGPFELVVPVSSVRQFDKKSPDLPLVHTLAARHLITDFVEDKAPLPAPIDPSTPVEDIRKAAIIRLGEEYQLASRYTSFVAVDRGQGTSENPRIRARARSGTQRAGQRFDGRDGTQSSPPQGGFFDTVLTWTLEGISSGFAALSGLFEGSSTRGSPSVINIPGAFPTSRSPSGSPPGATRDDSFNEQETDYDSTDTFSTMSSLEGSSDWSRPSTPEPQISAEEMERMRSPSPVVDFAHSAPPVGPSSHGARQDTASSSNAPPAPPPTPPPAPPPVPPQVSDIIRLQSFDGSFSLDNMLSQIVGLVDLEKPADLPGDDTMWATALAMAFLQKTLVHAGHSDLRAVILDKILEFVETKEGADFTQLVERAKTMIP